MNETLSIFLRGLLIGLSIAAPVGPIGVLCIRRTLAEGRLTGLLSGLGAASADMVYGALAAFGVGAVSQLLTGNAFWLRIIGGIFLLYLGLRTFLEKPADHAAQARQGGHIGAYASTFLLTITNPMTIFSFAAIFAGAMPTGTLTSPGLIVAGVFCGSASWWFFLSFTVALLREKISRGMMTWVNRISGLVIFGFGLMAVVSLI